MAPAAPQAAPSMRVLTLSDAHLLSADEPRARAMTALWAGPALSADLVVLGGDIFDFLVGRQREALRRYAPVLDALAALAATVDVVYVEGNHDFHLDGVLPGRVRVVQRFELSVGATRTVWQHGDLLLPDRRYRMLKRVLASHAVRLATESLPPRLVWGLATGWSHTSRRLHDAPTSAQLAAHAVWADQALNGAPGRLITGHFHTAAAIALPGGGEWRVLGPWLDAHRYAWVTPAGVEEVFAPAAG